MSHNRNHIIIQALIGTGLFNEADTAKLTAIGEKEDERCSTRDAETVGHIVKKKLREQPTIDEQD